MKEAVPCYYHKFKCIAQKCNHSCCVGWEIDVDDETMAIYSSPLFPMRDEIMGSIEGDPPHFVPGEGGRCPFLSNSGLCEIILRCGEDALCDICFLHPRFRNFYSSFFEVGLGLCCEEAARLVLSDEEKFSVIYPEKFELTQQEKLFFKKRDEIFRVLQNREITISERFSNLAKRYGFEFDFSLSDLNKLYLFLERLDETWTEKLKKLEGFCFDNSIFEDKLFSNFFEQLSVYFIFRHLPKALSDGDYASKVRFSLVSCYIIGALIAESGDRDFERCADIVRMYSSEIEYSQENTLAVMDRRDFS